MKLSQNDFRKFYGQKYPKNGRTEGVKESKLIIYGQNIHQNVKNKPINTHMDGSLLAIEPLDK